MWKGCVVEEVKKKGRPSLLTDSVRRSIIAQLQTDQFSTSKEITRAVVGDETAIVSDRTVRRFMSSLEYQNSLPRTIPFITDAQKTARV
jgi:hypothetical protein